ncbi:MAG TPA: helix-turn-helix domain-containing protein [candidate division Zixibacteria bacterium]|nr:helix-turn-helix domain-containing protein [candidate division Zixibacteria bacterium]
MDDARVGTALRLLRWRSGLSQRELARRAGVSRWAVSSIERGRLDAMPLRVARNVAETLGARLDALLRWRGGELDRLLDAAHAGLVEQVITILQAAGWEVWPEASFSVYGERGSVDVLAWHPVRRVLLVVEVKSRIMDVQHLLMGMDRKRRLAARIAAGRGWQPDLVCLWLAVADGRTNRRRLGEHRATFAAVFGADGRGLRGWLRDPVERVSFVSFLPEVGPGNRRRRSPRSGGQS